MKTCTITVTVKAGDTVIKHKTWRGVDVMKQSPQQGVARRWYNYVLADMNSCLIGQDKMITAHFEAYYGAPNHTRITGFLSGVNGKTWRADGIFER